MSLEFRRGLKRYLAKCGSKSILWPCVGVYVLSLQEGEKDVRR